jgi:hypothetical protein
MLPLLIPSAVLVAISIYVQCQTSVPYVGRYGRGLGIATPLTGECNAMQETYAVPSNEAFTFWYIDPTLQHLGVGHRECIS